MDGGIHVMNVELGHLGAFDTADIGQGERDLVQVRLVAAKCLTHAPTPCD